MGAAVLEGLPVDGVIPTIAVARRGPADRGLGASAAVDGSGSGAVGPWFCSAI